MEIDREHEDFPYLQIAADLRQGIEAGTYPPGTPIPSYTQLSDEYGVHLQTAQRAVHLLRSEGLVRTIRGRGTFVVRREG